MIASNPTPTLHLPPQIHSDSTSVQRSPSFQPHNVYRLGSAAVSFDEKGQATSFFNIFLPSQYAQILREQLFQSLYQPGLWMVEDTATAIKNPLGGYCQAHLKDRGTFHFSFAFKGKVSDGTVSQTVTLRYNGICQLSFVLHRQISNSDKTGTIPVLIRPNFQIRDVHTLVLPFDHTFTGEEQKLAYSAINASYFFFLHTPLPTDLVQLAQIHQKHEMQRRYLLWARKAVDGFMLVLGGLELMKSLAGEKQPNGNYERGLVQLVGAQFQTPSADHLTALALNMIHTCITLGLTLGNVYAFFQVDQKRDAIPEGPLLKVYDQSLQWAEYMSLLAIFQVAAKATFALLGYSGVFNLFDQPFFQPLKQTLGSYPIGIETSVALAKFGGAFNVLGGLELIHEGISAGRVSLVDTRSEEEVQADAQTAHRFTPLTTH